MNSVVLLLLDRHLDDLAGEGARWSGLGVSGYGGLVTRAFICGEGERPPRTTPFESLDEAPFRAAQLMHSSCIPPEPKPLGLFQAIK